MKLFRGESDHPYWKKPFTGEETAYVWWGLGACVITLGISNWLTPPAPPFTGRWSWLAAWAHHAFGTYGPAFMYFGEGALLVMVGFLYCRNAR
jgi:hypothetical protein